MAKYLKTWFFKELEQQVFAEEISSTRMLELIQDEVIKNYKKDNTFRKKIKRVFKDILLGIRVSNDFKQNHQHFGKL
jgi:hypothetical protein